MGTLAPRTRDNCVFKAFLSVENNPAVVSYDGNLLRHWCPPLRGKADRLPPCLLILIAPPIWSYSCYAFIDPNWSKIRSPSKLRIAKVIFPMFRDRQFAKVPPTEEVFDNWEG